MMNKTRIAVSLALFIGLGWLGATWYSGKLIEIQLQDNLAQANHSLRHLYPGINLVMDKANYKRGFFTSRVNIALYTANVSSSPLIFHETISHGPFPLFQFTQYWLSPALAEVQTTLLKTPESQLLFSASDGKKPISALTRIDFKSRSDTSVTFPALHIQDQGISLYSEGTTIKLAYNHKVQTLVYSADQKNFVIEFIDNAGIKHKITSAGMFFSVNTRHGINEPFASEQYFHSPFLSLDSDNRRLLSMKNVNYQTQVTALKQTLNLKLNYQSDEVSYLDQLVGNVDMSVSALKLPFAAVNNMVALYPNLLVPTRQAHSATTKMSLLNVLRSFGQQPSLNLDKFTVSNSKGTSKLAFHISAKDLDKLTLEQRPLASLIKDHITHLAWDMDINSKMAEEFLKIFQLTDGKHTDEQAQELAVNQLQVFKMAAQLSGLTKLGSNEIKSNFNYDSNRDAVNLNGQSSKLEAFIKN